MILFPDCGIGSDPNATGPCTGTYGPEYLGESVTGVFASGKGQILSVGAAILAMFAVVVLLNMIRRPLKRAKSESKAEVEAEAEAEAVCRECGGALSADRVDGTASALVCGECFRAAVSALEPGEGWCAHCGATFWRDEGDDWDTGCPCCGAGADEDEPPADAGTCSVCGVVTDELVGDLFPACHDCAAASEAQRATDEIGPDDEDTFDGNPDGIGGGGVRA